MKRISLMLAAALLAIGCASTPPAPPAAPQLSRWEAFAAAMNSAKDSTAQVAIAVAFAAEGGGRGAPQVQVETSIAGTLFQAALQATDILLRGYSIKTQRDVSIAQTNAQAQTTIAGYQAFTGIAAAGFGSNASIAGLIQAPAPNVTTTTTLSGTGVIGSGTYTGPITRTCTGGPAGAGAGTTPGGAGGPASC